MGVEGVFLEPIPWGHQGMIAHIKIFVMTPSCALHPALYQFHFSFRPGRGEHMATSLKKLQCVSFHPLSSTQKRAYLLVNCFLTFPNRPLFRPNDDTCPLCSVCQHPKVQNRTLLEGTQLSLFICKDFSRAPFRIYPNFPFHGSLMFKGLACASSWNDVIMSWFRP